MTRLRSILHHLVHYGETYLILPLTLLLIFGALHLYRGITGRPSLEDPLAEIVASLTALTPLVLLLALVGYVQTRMIGYRAAQEGAGLGDDVFDALVFFALLFSFAHLGGLR